MRTALIAVNLIVAAASAGLFGYTFFARSHLVGLAQEFVVGKTVQYADPLVGDVEKVVGDPQHPYTRLLVGSVPLPDPDKHWHGEPPPSEEARKAASTPHDGCAFAARCPDAMAICREARPPLYQLDEHRAAACYLYMGKPELPADELGKVMVPPAVPVESLAPEPAVQPASPAQRTPAALVPQPPQSPTPIATSLRTSVRVPGPISRNAIATPASSALPGALPRVTLPRDPAAELIQPY